MQPVLGPLTERLASLMEIDDAPGPSGSSYIDGWYGYVDKDLRSLLAVKPVPGAVRDEVLRRRRAGRLPRFPVGRVRRRGHELQATRAPTRPPGVPTRRRSASDFAPGILTDTMRWANRPTFQQVISFTGHRLHARGSPATRGSRSPLVAEKRYLFTPGPTPVPPEVLAALAEPVVHHRGPDYRELFGECLERLRAGLPHRERRPALHLLGHRRDGVGGREPLLARATASSSSRRARSASAGSKLAGRLRRRRPGGGVRVGRDAARRTICAARLDELGGAKAVFLTHSETSTGVVADLQALAAAAKPSGALVVVDAVSSLGAVPLETDAWGLDVVASGSQKALMTPPGLGARHRSRDAALGSARHERRASTSTGSARVPARRSSTARSRRPSRSSRALDVALGLLLDEGLEAAFDRHVRLGRACREGAKAMGLELFSPDEDRSAVVTGILTPGGHRRAASCASPCATATAITVAGGHGDLKNRLFRIGHIGYYDVFDITTALAAVELALAELGADIERGVGGDRGARGVRARPSRA